MANIRSACTRCGCVLIWRSEPSEEIDDNNIACLTSIEMVIKCMQLQILLAAQESYK